MRIAEKIVDRFWSKVDKGGPDECWEWLGYKAINKYGTFNPFYGKTVYAHRFSFEIENGFKPEICMHKCDNPSCVNPKHLESGTQKDNMVDCVQKKRHWSSKKTHCKQGHEFSEKNLYVTPSGKRVCKQCRRAYDRIRKSK
jgi:hypothetical protein